MWRKWAWQGEGRATTCTPKKGKDEEGRKEGGRKKEKENEGRKDRKLDARRIEGKEEGWEGGRERVRE